MIKTKKGVSAVVATVLIVLITFMAVGLVWGIILPMVKESLSKGASCFELRDYVKIIEGDYTCYNTAGGQTKIMMERGMENISIGGFRVSIFAGGSSTTYNVVPGSTEVGMLNGGDVEIPKPGEARTYIFNITGGKAEIGILLKGEKICAGDSSDIPRC